jgi:hypothetical protein
MSGGYRHDRLSAPATASRRNPLRPTAADYSRQYRNNCRGPGHRPVAATCRVTPPLRPPDRIAMRHLPYRLPGADPVRTTLQARRLHVGWRRLEGPEASIVHSLVEGTLPDPQGNPRGKSGPRSALHSGKSPISPFARVGHAGLLWLLGSSVRQCAPSGGSSKLNHRMGWVKSCGPAPWLTTLIRVLGRACINNSARSDSTPGWSLLGRHPPWADTPYTR